MLYDQVMWVVTGFQTDMGNGQVSVAIGRHGIAGEVLQFTSAEEINLLMIAITQARDIAFKTHKREL